MCNLMYTYNYIYLFIYWFYSLMTKFFLKIILVSIHFLNKGECIFTIWANQSLKIKKIYFMKFKILLSFINEHSIILLVSFLCKKTKKNIAALTNSTKFLPVQSFIKYFCFVIWYLIINRITFKYFCR